MGDKTINFRARNETDFKVQLKPYPAVKGLPKWFLDAEPYEKHYTGSAPDDGKVHVRHRVSNATFKKCVPMLDGMSAGYIIPLWADVEVSNLNPNCPELYWRTHADVFEQHGDLTRKITTPSGYHPQVFKYLNTWIPQTPKGYSCIVTTPFGHNDLVFRAIPAVIDTDRFKVELIFPVWVKNDFNGIVEKGTPIVQIIPFKRDNWNSTFDFYEGEDYRYVVEEKGFNSTIVGHYLKNVWSKKKFK